MQVRTFAAIAMAMAAGLLGCGGTVTSYRGTMTSASTFNGATSTSTTTGQSVLVYTGGEAGSVLVDMGEFVLNMTKSGDTLNAAPGQGLTQTQTSSNSAQNVTSGTGTQNAMGLTLSVTGTYSSTSGGTTSNGTFTLSFNGTKQ